jgi:LEA14-like dessication related protein
MSARGWTAMLWALLCAGCTLAPKFQTPQLSVVDVQMLGGDLWSQRLKVRVHVQNPNERPLPVRSLDYTLEVEGQTFATGASTEAFTVPALGESDFDMNVTTNLAGTMLKLLTRGASADNNVAYRLSGTLSLSAGLLRSIPFDQRGSFKLQ